jgi:OTU domain-containing protein 6
VQDTAAWGGQVELGALARALRRQIRVYAVGMPLLTLGDEYAGEGSTLEVCYLRHAFGLGEHYNSVEPLQQEGGGGGEEEEEGVEEEQQGQQLQQQGQQGQQQGEEAG